MREKIISGGIYHVLNRGVDKREVFLDNQDYMRFIHDMFEFNDIAPANNLSYYFSTNNSIDVGRRYIGEAGRKPRKLLVKILAFCLMPNHYHLLLQPIKDNGVSEFMKKLNGGYTKYFNEKNERSGALFQGKYKYIRIVSDAHFIHIPFYIHLNPLDMKMPEWRKRKIINYRDAIKFLENYKWSSFQDYVGKKNFPSVTQRDFLLKFFDGTENYKKEIENWLKNISVEFDLIKTGGFLLE